MKKSSLVSAIALLALAVPSAFARTPAPPYEKANLISFDIDPNASYAKSVAGGNVTIDHNAGEIALVLFQKTECPEGRPCPRMIRPPVTIRVPITRIETNECGIRVFSAERDDLPVDGARVTLTVEDNSENTCPTLLPLPPTSITHTSEIYDRRTGTLDKLQSTFTAEKLVRTRH